MKMQDVIKHTNGHACKDLLDVSVKQCIVSQHLVECVGKDAVSIMGGLSAVYADLVLLFAVRVGFVYFYRLTFHALGMCFVSARRC